MEAAVRIALWLLDSGLAAAAVLAVGVLGLRLVRQPVRRQRLGQWTLAGCLLMAALACLPGWPRWSLGWIEPGALGSPRAAADMRGIEAFGVPGVAAGGSRIAEADVQGGTVGSGAGSAAGFGISIGAAVTLGVVGIYLLLAGACAVRLAGGFWTLRRLTRAGAEPPGRVAELWEELTVELRRRPRLRVSREVCEPVSFGLWRPVVLLPATLAERGEAGALRIVLSHELVHIRRRDAWTWLLAGLVQVVFFYQPVYWLLRRELRLAQEFVADACAAGGMPSAGHYAAGLLQMLQGSPRPVPAGVSGAFGRRSDFYRRMERLLAQVPTERACTRRWTWVCGVVVLMLSLAAGSLTVRAREAGNDPRVLETRGVRYLLGQQGPQGGWLEEVGPAPTALVLKGLLQAGVPLEHPSVRRGLAFVEGFRQADHGFYRDTEPAYNTAIVLSLLTMLPDSRHQQQVAEGREFLRELQRPAPAVSPWYRGGPTLGGWERPAWADQAERSPEAVLETYGRLTYAGLKSMVYAGLTRDDQRVRQAARWLGANWTLECNPGLGTAEGQYYYYHMLAKTLAATGAATVTDRRGAVHDWRRELAGRLGQLQQADGSWVNRRNPRWLEDRPALVTAYCVLALQESRH